MAKVIIHLRKHEYRTPKAQAALIIRRELQQPGSIPGKPPVPMQQSNIQVGAGDKLEVKGGQPCLQEFLPV